MEQKNTKKKPTGSDDYKGVKKESATIIITEKNGKVTKIKI